MNYQNPIALSQQPDQSLLPEATAPQGQNDWLQARRRLAMASLLNNQQQPNMGTPFAGLASAGNNLASAYAYRNLSPQPVPAQAQPQAASARVIPGAANGGFMGRIGVGNRMFGLGG